jgi:hypothetical protein
VTAVQRSKFLTVLIMNLGLSPKYIQLTPHTRRRNMVLGSTRMPSETKNSRVSSFSGGGRYKFKRLAFQLLELLSPKGSHDLT